MSNPIMDPTNFKNALLQSLLNPKERENILEMVKKMTPQMSDIEREKFFDVTMNQLNNSSSSQSASKSPMLVEDVLKLELQKRLDLVSKSVSDIMLVRNAYYTQHQIYPPAGYEPREDLSKWDFIDIFETAKKMDQEKLNEYKTYLKQKLN